VKTCNVGSSRPKRGLSPAEAFRHWSDKVAYSELVKLAGTDDLPPISFAGTVIRGDPQRESEYCRKRHVLEEAFKRKLVDATLIGSGIPEGRGGREMIEPSLWEVLQIELDFYEDAASEGCRYEKIEFFKPSAIPANIRSIPGWLSNLPGHGSTVFTHDPTYEHVSLGSFTFTLGPIQAKIVQQLHEASKLGEWRPGKVLLARADSQQIKLSEVFKSKQNWRELIESDGRGRYRLRQDA
jgi:hypothetical protein